MMKKLPVLAFGLSVFTLMIIAASTGVTGMPVTNSVGVGEKQTIIMIRHGEKPKDGLGQLNVTGLKRSLLLPDFFKTHFPSPDAIFAPNPDIQHFENHGDKKYHYYIRPLLTIAPTAITLGLPVNTGIGLDAPDELIKALLAPQYHSSTIIVAWEHSQIVEIAEKLINRFGSDAVVPDWSNNNYNMFFVFTIDWRKATDQLTFSVRSENFPDLRSVPVCPPYLDGAKPQTTDTKL